MLKPYNYFEKNIYNKTIKSIDKKIRIKKDNAYTKIWFYKNISNNGSQIGIFFIFLNDGTHILEI